MITSYVSTFISVILFISLDFFLMGYYKMLSLVPASSVGLCWLSILDIIGVYLFTPKKEELLISILKDLSKEKNLLS